MSIAVFLLLTAAVAVALVYPLVPGRHQVQAGARLSDGEIERAVRGLERARTGEGHRCASCGHSYRPGDRFCVQCGASLPQAAPSGRTCPECGESVQEGDSFCSKCGHRAPAGETL